MMIWMINFLWKEANYTQDLVIASFFQPGLPQTQLKSTQLKSTLLLFSSPFFSSLLSLFLFCSVLFSSVLFSSMHDIKFDHKPKLALRTKILHWSGHRHLAHYLVMSEGVGFGFLACWLTLGPVGSLMILCKPFFNTLISGVWISLDVYLCMTRFFCNVSKVDI